MKKIITFIFLVFILKNNYSIKITDLYKILLINKIQNLNDLNRFSFLNDFNKKNIKKIILMNKIKEQSLFKFI